MDILKKAKQKIFKDFFAKDKGIIGVGIGKKIVGGKETDELSVRVYVLEKKDNPKFFIPPEIEIDGVKVKTDVIVMRMPKVQDVYTQRIRPLIAGYSVGHKDITAGTIGGFVKYGDKICILSNNHVLANSNNGKIGDEILQPGTADSGTVELDTVAHLTKFAEIKLIGKFAFNNGLYTEEDFNKVDCAIAELVDGIDFVNRTEEFQMPKIITDAVINMPVKKCGRTTGFTYGKITDINLLTVVQYDSRKYGLFDGQLLIQEVNGGEFSAGGDSGSMIVTEDGANMVGLLFAGGSFEDGTLVTIANHIDDVFSALGIETIT